LQLSLFIEVVVASEVVVVVVIVVEGIMLFYSVVEEAGISVEVGMFVEALLLHSVVEV
jgi:hypothetical protein